MAWTAPRTWVTGELVTAALLNTHLRDNLTAIVPNGPDAWTSFTPTLVQSAAVTKTVTYARYMKVGRLVTAVMKLDVTGAGVAANRIDIGLPVTAASSGNIAAGSGAIWDASAAIWYAGVPILVTTSAVAILLGSGAVSGPMGATGGGMTAALAAGDIATVSLVYESAT